VRLFFTTDSHGSKRCYLELLNAQAYRADALVLGGEIAGKPLVRLVAEPDGRGCASVFGQLRLTAEQVLPGLEGVRA
jgi:Icc-related predicted phosphoesterase